MSDSNSTLIIRNARIASPAGTSGPVRGEQLGELEIIERADVVVTGDRITKITKKRAEGAGPRAEGKAKTSSHSALSPHTSARATELDANGRVLLPGFVDCHTHACWAGGGARLDEWDQKRRGVPYLKILAAGGGIMATVRAVRDIPFADLVDQLVERINRMLSLGSTTIEVKSGYGLNTETELKMLRAIRAAQERFAGTLIPTALLGHAIDESQPGFVGKVVRETLPAVAAEFPGIAIDSYVEKGAWSVEQATLLYARARDLGLPMRVHADQFNSLGMVPAAIKMGFRSVDHLEASTREDLDALAKAPSTFGVMLPACAFHLKAAYARGRHFVEEGIKGPRDQGIEKSGGNPRSPSSGSLDPSVPRSLSPGGLLAIATNYNPGSAPCASMPFIIALAVRHLGLSPQEAITAATANPAAVLGLKDRGRIAVGQRADLVLLRENDERDLAFSFGDSPIQKVICSGRVVA